VDGEAPKTPAEVTDGADGAAAVAPTPAPPPVLVPEAAPAVAAAPAPEAAPESAPATTTSTSPATDASPDPAPPPPASPSPPESTGETPQTTSIAPALSAPDRSGGSLGSEGSPRRGSRLRAILAVLGSLAAIGAIVLPFAFRGGADRPAGVANAASLAGVVSASGLGAPDASDDGAEGGGNSEDAAPLKPAQWRVARLADDPAVTLVEGTIGRRPLLVALGAAGLSRAEAHRVVGSLQDVRDVDHFDPKDTFALARDKASGRVVAFEIAGSPVDVWQAREDVAGDGAPRLVTRRLELSSERVRIRKSVLVGADLRASFVDAGLAPIDDVLSMLDDALEGHAELSDIRPGARLRIVATLERVDGAFVRWAALDAVEYFPASPSAPAVRVYWFGDEDHRHGWYDAKGRQPTHGGWRMPIPLARVVSPFNPHRMHPVLHVVMPHNGVDLRASSGTPVYATAAGTVVGVGNEGPCGNKVEISHPGGISSVYCHLSRFAAGLHVGQHVEARQLIAYVGQTGRVTGPHLHFGIKKGGQFIDPMTLRLDTVRVVPRSRRDDFDRVRSSLDAELDAIPLPTPTPSAEPAPKEPSEPGEPNEPNEPNANETFYEEP
jgi:hypothetical protein